MGTKLRLLEVNQKKKQKERVERTFLLYKSVSLKCMSGNHLNNLNTPLLHASFLIAVESLETNTGNDPSINWEEDIECLRLAASTPMLVILRKLSMPLESLSIKKVGSLLP